MQIINNLPEKEEIAKEKYILVVEDDYNLGKIYTLSLKHVGYEVALNNDGKNLMQMINERKPDLLVLDMHVPYSWGPDIIKKLREAPQKSDMKILITTADIMVGHTLSGQGEYVLIKPVQVARLIKVVEEMLGK